MSSLRHGLPKHTWILFYTYNSNHDLIQGITPRVHCKGLPVVHIDIYWLKIREPTHDVLADPNANDASKLFTL